MGFLTWLSNYCFGCIIHNQINRKRPTTKYFIISSAETRELNLFKELPDPHFVVARLCDVLDFNDPNVQEVKYIIQFLSSSSTLKKSEKQKVQRKHKSTKQSKLYKERLRNKNALKYKEMDFGKKRELSIKNSLKYKEMERGKKSELRKKNALKYKEMESGKKSELRKKNALKFKEVDPTKKKVINKNKVAKYRATDPSDKKMLLKKRENKYKPINASEKKVLLEKQAVCYKGMNTREKEACLKRKRSNMKSKYHAVDSPGKAKEHETSNTTKFPKYDLDYFICSFRNKIKDGPCYICCVCNRLLYRKSVKLLNTNTCNSSLPESVFTKITSFDEKEYICATCHSKVTKGKIPCQAVYNNMSVDEIPPELALLEKLEQILIAQRIVFEKIIVMPKGQQKKYLEQSAMYQLTVIKHVKFYHDHLKGLVL